MLNIAVLVSGGGTNLQALLDSEARGENPSGKIRLVVASKPGVYALERAANAGVEGVVVRRKDYASSEDFDAALLKTLKEHNIDLVVLAGFLSVLGPSVIEAYPRRILNIHPALIPSFCGPGMYGLRPHEAALARAEEKISKTKALELYDTGLLDAFPVGTFAGLQKIHGYLFGEIYPFAGQMRTVNIAKGNFRFAPVMYLAPALESIDAMPQSTFDEIIEKYVEMNVAHPFREGNGRSTRIWLDCILKKELHQVIDWSRVDKSDYLLAMERSPVKDVEIKALLRAALTDRITDRLVYMKGIDASYHYEGYHVFRTAEL